MPATIPVKEPSEFRAGDTVQWVKSLSDYSAEDGWVLSYYLVGAARLTIVATESGSDFAIEIPATQTATLQAGDYFLEGKVSNGTQTFTVCPARRVVVLPNFASDAQVAPGYDGRSYYRKTLDTLKSMFQGAVAFPESGYTIFGERNVTLKTFAEIQGAIAWLESKVAEEDKAEAAKAGKRTGIYMRFRSPC
jgi:hypothetical protein